MASSTTNTYIGPQDGWTQVAATGATFLRVSAYPHTHPFQIYFGASAPSTRPANATGTVIFAVGVPVAGQTVTIGTEVYTFRAAATLPFEVTIAATNLLTSVNFAAAVNLYSTLVTAVDAAGTTTVTAKLPGTQGNYAMSETATNVTVGGAAMTGGAEIVDGVTVCHKPYWSNIVTTQPCWVRVVRNVPDSKRFDGRLRVDTIVH